MRLPIALVALALLPACSSDKNSGGDDLAACEQSEFDLKGCNVASLDAFASGGPFNLQLTNTDGTPAGVAGMALDPTGAHSTFFGQQQDVQVKLGGGTFFASAPFNINGTDGQVSIAGCEATSGRQLRGFFRRCNVGFNSVEGTFVAEQLVRRDGEAESSGNLQLVAERPLSGALATSLYVSGNTAYVIAENTGIFRYDITDPTNPTSLDSVTIAARKDLVGTTDRWASVAVVGDNLFVTSDVRGLLVFNLKNLASAALVLPASIADARALNNLHYDAAKDHLYGFSQESGGVLAYGTPGATPTLLGNYLSGASPSTGDAPLDGAARGDFLYLSHGTAGLVVLNVSKPEAPVRVGVLPAANNSRTLVLGDYPSNKVYAFETGAFWGSKVRVLDVTNPLNMSAVGPGYATRDAVPVSRMAFANNSLYVAYAQDGLRVLDVSNPASPVQKAYFNTWRASDPGHGLRFTEGATGVALGSNGYVYVADTTRGLMVFREGAGAAGSAQGGAAR
ncbi:MULTISPECIES: LVIVD repeat-containing protein [Myxococcaceae]|uniref:LVIVD repeat-containing protein n=1 Tax=Myxococcaceae TaxID=31 RepID=UPI00188E2C8F|nr:MULTISPECIES: hypothetical protein [Myxococcaceae]MBF5044863.1 hypothetical protein [Simulacricoccus sp. 17bor-14]